VWTNIIDAQIVEHIKNRASSGLSSSLRLMQQVDEMIPPDSFDQQPWPTVLLQYPPKPLISSKTLSQDDLIG